MKKFITNIFVAVFALASFAVAGNVHASTTINTTSGTFETTSPIFVSTDKGNTWSTSAHANVGDEVWVEIYIHNSGNETANGVIARMSPQTSTSKTTHTFSGSISGSNVSNNPSGSVTVSTSTLTDLIYQNKTRIVYGADDSNPQHVDFYDASVFSGIAVDPIATDSTCVPDGYNNLQCHQVLVVAKFLVQSSNGGGGTQNPTVTTSAPSVSGTSATLNGYVYPNGNTVNTCFKWGTSSSNLYNNLSVGSASNSQNISYTLSGLSTGTYYYEACAQLNGQEYDGSIQSFVIGSTQNNSTWVRTDSYTQNTTSATINGYAYTSNGSYETTYFKWGTGYNNLYNRTNSNSLSYSGSFNSYITNLAPSTTYYYQACISDSYNGEQCGSVNSFSTDGSYNPPVVTSNVVATTLPATGVSTYSAQIEGLVINNNGGAATCWFEYGTTTALGNTTSAQSIGSSNSAKCYDTISGLQSNKFYFYRIIADPTNGPNAFGEIRTFRTFGGETIPTETVHTRIIRTVVEAPRGVTTIAVGSGTGSNLVQLAVDSRYDTVCANETMDYTVTYKNISNKDISNVFLKVLLPTEITFTNSSTGVYSQSDHSVVVQIGTLKSGDEESIHVTGTLANDVAVRDNLVATATMTYTHPVTAAQENAIAYKLNQVVPCTATSSLAGLALFGNGFFPTTLIGWLILILIILAIVYLTRRLYVNRRSQTTTVTHTTDTMNLPR